MNDSPGTYYLDIETTGDADYTVSVEQCENNDIVNDSSEQDDESIGRFTQTAQRNQPAGDDIDTFVDDLDEDLDDPEDPDSPDENLDELEE